MPTDEELKQLNAVYDEPSRYDYLWKDYAEGQEGSKKIVDQVKIKVRNQYSNKDTYKACSCYWLTAIYNWYQVVEYKKNGLNFDQEDPRRKRLAFQNERGNINSWASLQDLMCFFKKRGLIDWYLRTKTVEETKNAIKNGCLIYTGSSKCSRSKTSKAKEFVYDPDWANHCFAIIDFDDTWFVAINSFGEDRGDKGVFHIDYDKYQYLFSTYAIIDHDDTGKLDSLKFDMEYQKAIESGITNGSRPNDPATRKEVAVMIYRVAKNLVE